MNSVLGGADVPCRAGPTASALRVKVKKEQFPSALLLPKHESPVASRRLLARCCAFD